MSLSLRVFIDYGSANGDVKDALETVNPPFENLQLQQNRINTKDGIVE